MRAINERFCDKLYVKRHYRKTKGQSDLTKVALNAPHTVEARVRHTDGRTDRLTDRQTPRSLSTMYSLYLMHSMQANNVRSPDHSQSSTKFPNFCRHQLLLAYARVSRVLQCQPLDICVIISRVKLQATIQLCYGRCIG